MGRNPCQFIVTGTYGKNEEPSLKVRCHCMGIYGSNPHKSFRYDALGLAYTMREAKEVWERHCQERVLESLTRLALDDTLMIEEEPT